MKIVEAYLSTPDDGDGELARSLKVIRKSIEEARKGKGRPMKQFLEELAARYGINLRK